MQHLRPRLSPLLLLLLPLAPALAQGRGPAPSARSSASNGPPVEIHVSDDDVSIVEKYVNPAFALPASLHRSRRGTARAIDLGKAGPVGGKQAASSLCFANDVLPSGQPTYPMIPGQELIDWGSKSCGSSTVVTRFQVRLETDALDQALGGPGTVFGLKLYAGTSGGAPGQLGTLIAEYDVISSFGTTDPATPVTVLFERSFPTPLLVPDGPIGWGYVDQGQQHGISLVRTAGGDCSGSLGDPTTGTFDCLADYDYPADAGGAYYGTFEWLPGITSTFFRLYEEDVFPAFAIPFNIAPNPSSYVAEPPRIGRIWKGTVDLTTTGHTNALVFAFESAAQIPLSGGQQLLIADSGSGELLGFAPRPGPLAVFTIPVPMDVSMLGRYVGSQAIHFGGVFPFALSNAMDLYLGTN